MGINICVVMGIWMGIRHMDSHGHMNGHGHMGGHGHLNEHTNGLWAYSWAWAHG